MNKKETAQPHSAGADRATPLVYQLHIKLDRTRPPIWRRLRVPGTITLDRLHHAIQVSMGWEGEHLHAFTIDGESYSHGDPDYSLPAEDYALQDLVKEPGAKFQYEYDFGDSWVHTIKVEKIEAVEKPMKTLAECLGGKNACPPEDCGGVGAYAHLCYLLSKPEDPEYERALEWLSADFDPASFDKDVVNLMLKKLS